MPERWRFTSTPRTRIAKVRVADIAGRQAGVISRAQLHAAAYSNAVIARAEAVRELHRIHPGVFAVGHRALSLHGRLWAALLYGGDGAAFSHQTGAWQMKLIATEPRTLHISTPRRRSSAPGVRVHGRRRFDAIEYGGFPVTPLSMILVDLAATMVYLDLRRVLAEADFRGLLIPAEIEAAIGRGKPGSAALRRALDSHLPELARTKSRTEERFLLLRARNGVPIPEVNVIVEGFKVDCVWRRERVVVELDSQAAHGSVARVEDDRHRDLVLRAAGYVVRRYTWRQVTREPNRVLADLWAARAAPRGSRT